MVKSELIEQAAARMSRTYTESERWLNTYIGLVYEVLADDGEVNISGFGKFSVSHREARIGVNPRQWEKRITIPALVTPKFRAGEKFKEAIKPALKK